MIQSALFKFFFKILFELKKVQGFEIKMMMMMMMMLMLMLMLRTKKKQISNLNQLNLHYYCIH